MAHSNSAALLLAKRKMPLPARRRSLSTASAAAMVLFPLITPPATAQQQLRPITQPQQAH
ncbi:hypothetical protein M2243_001893 [Heliophilum fasciatum]|nr:hypothetical protein [Heliophilum fasciatum]MCW2278446.1 hypothetical protein [Heliophilum fasciatum]